VSGQVPDPTGAKILDAAARVLADFGFKRATVELVAKYAGVSHMTVYRRWSTKNELLRAAALRELSAVLDGAFSCTGRSESFREQVLGAFADTVWSVQHHPLMRRELDTDRDALLPLMATGSGAVMESVLPQISARLLHLATDSDVVVEDPDALADVFVRLAHSLLVVERSDRPLSTRSDVADYAHRALGPLVGTVASTPAPELHVVADELAELAVGSPARRRPRLHLAAASLLVTGLLGGALLVYPVEREFTPTDSSSTSVSATTPAPPSSIVAPPPLPSPVPTPASALLDPPAESIAAPEPSDSDAPFDPPPAVSGPSTPADTPAGGNNKPSPQRRPPTPPPFSPPKVSTQSVRPPSFDPGRPHPDAPSRTGAGAGAQGGPGPH
jgi:AcrR family transcriptional regulator